MQESCWIWVKQRTSRMSDQAPREGDAASAPHRGPWGSGEAWISKFKIDMGNWQTFLKNYNSKLCPILSSIPVLEKCRGGVHFFPLEGPLSNWFFYITTTTQHNPGCSASDGKNCWCLWEFALHDDIISSGSAKSAVVTHHLKCSKVHLTSISMAQVA